MHRGHSVSRVGRGSSLHFPAFSAFGPVPRAIPPAVPSCRPCHLRSRPRRFRARTPILDSAKEPPSGVDGGLSSRGEFWDDEITVGDALRAWSKARDAGRTPGRAPPKKKTIGVLFVGKDNSSVTVAAEAIFSDMVTRRASPSVRIFCHSAGTRVQMEGAAPDPMFIEGLRFKRGLDVSSHAAASVSVTDLETYDLIVCTDEATRSELLYMIADESGRHSIEVEAKFVTLSNYCSQEKLRSLQLRDGKYSRDALNMLLSTIIDACTGLLTALLEPPTP